MHNNNDRPAPLGALVVMFHVIIVWAKLISYVQVNQHFRTVVRPKEVAAGGGGSGRTSPSTPPPKTSGQAAAAEEVAAVCYPNNLTVIDMYVSLDFSCVSLCVDMSLSVCLSVRFTFILVFAAFNSVLE